MARRPLAIAGCAETLYEYALPLHYRSASLPPPMLAIAADIGPASTSLTLMKRKDHG
jgi:hypothetical protein